MDSWKRYILFLILLVIVTGSGCISQPADNTSSPITITKQPREESTPRYIGDHRYWIRIDPIADFRSESPFTVTGTSKFNINVTTNYPEGSLFWVKIVEVERSRPLMSEVLVPSSVNSDGVNSFSYPFDIQGNPPAHYHVEIRKANQNVTGPEEFRIILIPSKEPWLWVHIDPIIWPQQDENLNVTGTTNLPVGSEISLESATWGHTCVYPVPGSPPINKTGMPRSYCNGGCNENIEGTCPVIKGNQGINLWSVYSQYNRLVY